MGSQPEDVDIFSLCNCVTLGMPRTYTAHAMTMDLFLNYAAPGVRYPRPHIDLWSKTFVRVFKTPEVVRVFLFSIFNEVYLPSYIWKDGCRGVEGARMSADERFTMGFGRKYDRLKVLSISVPRYQPYEFAQKLIHVGEKADQIWPGVKKVILRYDLTRAKPKVKEDFLLYESAIERAVNWPIVEVHDPNGPPARKNHPHLWCHYGEQAIVELHGDILETELNYQRRKIDG